MGTGVKAAPSKRPARKKMGVAELASLKFTRSDTPFELLPDQVAFSANTASCETCGSHGLMRAAFNCPLCGHWHEVEFSFW